MDTRDRFSAGRKLDYRRFTVFEGSAYKEPLHYGGLGPRKKLHSADEIQHGCRPNPEGAGSVSARERSTGRPCQRCHILTNQLNRQALALAESGPLKSAYIKRTCTPTVKRTVKYENGPMGRGVTRRRVEGCQGELTFLCRDSARS
ncbi:hypothetical protein AMELA_G00281720 [Ameiurus melas]|uniref:Uncharacterized protein n=1 Tax=Ameiurus melas TaxID=219545 RepID=A0A7J5ZN09_AMEME|nr:hypothetical protein AMELA_G00281720 [Ameiurus melas]